MRLIHRMELRMPTILLWCWVFCTLLVTYTFLGHSQLHFQWTGPQQDTPLSQREEPYPVPSHRHPVTSNVTKIVHYIWCHRPDRYFMFQHYLSLKRAVQLLQPDSVYFHYAISEPVQDKNHYSTWYEEFKNDYLSLEPYKLGDKKVQEICEGTIPNKEQAIFDLISKTGGIYISENTFLLDVSLEAQTKDFVNNLYVNENYTTGFFIARKNILQGKSIEDLKSVSKEACLDLKIFEHITNSTPVCVNMEELYPKDIWRREGKFGQMARYVAYGKPEKVEATQSFTELSPNIAHMVWIGGDMDFIFYLSVLSVIHIVSVDGIYIYGVTPPSGPYWERVKSHPKIHWIYHTGHHMVYGQLIHGRMQVKDIADIIRLEMLDRYGGMYLDVDIIFVKPLSDAIRSYDTVLSKDWIKWHDPFPDVINNGLMIGKPGAKFWRLFQEGFKDYRPEEILWTPIRLPYKILERHPEVAHIDDHLQVLCYQGKCHPTWWPDYHTGRNNHLDSQNQTLDWRSDAYAFHMTTPPVELLNVTNLMQSDSMIAQIGKYVLEKAGVDPKML